MLLDALWKQLAANDSTEGSVSWGVATHPYDDGDPRHNLSAQGVATFSTLDDLVREPQRMFLAKYASVPPQGMAIQPQTTLFADEQGWQLNPAAGVNDTVRARNICFAQSLSVQ